MIKVRILDRCEFCDGEAYVFVGEDVDSKGAVFERYRPWEMYHGSGNRAKWVSLRDLSDMLEGVISTELDYLEFAREEPVSQYQYSCETLCI